VVVKLGCFLSLLDFLLRKEFCDTEEAGTGSWRYVPRRIIVPLALLTGLLDNFFARFLGGRSVILLNFHHHFEAMGFDVVWKQSLDIVIEFQLFAAHDTPLDVIVGLPSFVPIRLFSTLG
jgi:hypothetical protein